MNLVPEQKILKDPRKLSFLFPSMSLRRYKELTDNYYREKCLYTLEKVAQLTGRMIVPCAAIHWQRKKRYADRYLELFGKAYYLFRPDELTEKERKKYEEMLAESLA